MSKHNKGISPYGENGKLTETTTFTLQDGTEVNMIMDIDLNGNTGAVTFTQKKPNVLQNTLDSLGSSFRVYPKEPNFHDRPVDKETQKLIEEDANGIVASNHKYLLNNVKEKITANGEDVTLFEEAILDNKNTDVVGAVENGFNKDINEDDYIGSTEESNNQPEEFKAPQFGKDENFRYPLDIKYGDGDDQTFTYEGALKPTDDNGHDYMCASVA